MIRPLTYRVDEDVGPLEDWPFTGAESRYVIRSGTPRASGRLDAGGPGHPTRSGIWRCTMGVFDCTEQGHEMMTVLAGRCEIMFHDTGKTLTLRPGDTAFLPDGARVTWTIHEDLTKVFHAYKPTGY